MGNHWWTYLQENLIGNLDRPSFVYWFSIFVFWAVKQIYIVHQIQSETKSLFGSVLYNKKFMLKLRFL